MIYVILGETASGKTDVALRICRENNVPLISSDAYSVYKGFDIGSSKPSEKELEGIEHYFISSKEFNSEMTVYEFQKEGRKILDKLIVSNRDVVVAGGTFLYVRALLFPYEFKEYEGNNKLRELPYEEAKKKLVELEPDIENYVDLNNPRRVVTALNNVLNGKSIKELKKDFINNPIYPCVFIRIKTNTSELHHKIEQRVYSMAEEGLFEEADKLIKLNPEFASTFKGIGFKEIYQGKKDNLSNDIILNNIISDTKKYAKRQKTFMNHQFPYFIEMEKDEIAEAVRVDIERRKNMRKQVKDTDLPLVPRLAIEYIPVIDFLYSNGVRQIAVYSIDKGLVEDFVYKVHLKSPLMQIIVFDHLDFDNPKLPKMTYALPYLETIRHDDLLDKFIKEKKIEHKIPSSVQDFINKEKL